MNSRKHAAIYCAQQTRLLDWQKLLEHPDLETKFCIIAAPRTGSNWLCSALDAHPQVVCHYEVFHRWQIFSSFHDPLHDRPIAYAAVRLYRDIVPIRFMNTLVERSFAEYPEASAVGFKLFPEHNRRVLRRVIEDDQWKIIFLTRNNYLAQYSSFKIAKASGSWATSNASKKKKKLHFDAKEFQHFAQGRAAETDRMTAMLAGRDHLRLDYAEIRSRIDEVFDLVGADVPEKGALSTQIVKQNTDDLLARFDNPEDVLTGLSAEQQSDYLGS